MRSYSSRWRDLLGKNRRGTTSVSLLNAVKNISSKDNRRKMAAVIITLVILVATPLGLYLKANAAYLELSNEDWSTIPAENVDGLITSVSGKITLNPHNVADDWCNTANCNETLPYRKLITINNPGETTENAIVSLSVPYDSDMKDDFSDLRFVSKDTLLGETYTKGEELQYYFVKKSSSSGSFDVQLPNLKQGTQQIYVYFGNPNFESNYSEFKSIATTTDSSCAIGDNDKAYCWGNRYSLSFSSRRPISIHTSSPMSDLTIKSLSLGYPGSACLIASDDNAYCWGSNSGTGVTPSPRIPTIIDRSALNDSSIKSISIGGHRNACLIAADDNAYCWGSFPGNSNAFPVMPSTVPVAVDQTGALSGLTIKSISAGDSHSCAVASNDNAYCWGDFFNGKRGDNNTGDGVLGDTPVAVDRTGALSGLTIKSIAAGGSHTCAIASDDNAYCWGNNEHGQLGLATPFDPITQNPDYKIRYSPVAVDRTGELSGKTIKSISSGFMHTCATASDDKVYCWGSNADGQLGNNGLTSSTVPVAVDSSTIPGGLAIKTPDNEQHSTLSAGVNSTCAISVNNKAYCWGGIGTSGGWHIGDGSVGGVRIPTAVAVTDDIYQSSTMITTTSSFGEKQHINDQITKTGNLTSLTMDTIDKPLFDKISISSSGSGTIKIKVRTDTNDDMSTAKSWSTCNLMSNNDNVYDSTCVNFGDRYLQYQVFMTDDTPVDLTITKISFSFHTDLLPPTTNALNLSVKTGPEINNRTIKDSEGNGNGFNTSAPPYISWSSAVDNGGGLGIEGYCLYLGFDATLDLLNDSGELPAGSSPVDTHGLCQFAVSGTSYDTSSAISRLSQTTGTIYFAIQAFDKLMNVYPTPTVISYKIDNIKPSSNPRLVGPTMPQKSKAVVVNWSMDLNNDIGFWDEAEGSGIAGVKYCVVNMDGNLDNCSNPNVNWYGPALSPGGLNNIDDVFDANSRQLITSLDHPTINESGDNQIHVVAIDKAGNVSLPSMVKARVVPDPVAPIANAKNIVVKTSSATNARVITDSNGNGDGLVNGTPPYITWDAAVDDPIGTGIKGYCINSGYVTTKDNGDKIIISDPALNATNSPINTNGLCKYAVATTYFQMPEYGYTYSTEWHFSVQAFDQMHNLYPTPTTVSYTIDSEPPEFNTAITGPSGITSSKTVTLNWLQIEGEFGIMDEGTGVAGLKYCIHHLTDGGNNNCESPTGNWFGPAGAIGGMNNLSDLYPASTGQLITRANDPNMTNEGILMIYVVAIDNIGNISDPQIVIVTISDSPATAPSNLTVNPTSSPANNFSFTWAPPEFYLGSANDIDYCWTVNEEIAKDGSNCHWTGKNVLSLPAGPYATKQKNNIFYLIAKNQAGVFDNESFASAVFDTSTPAPGPPSKLTLTDVSIRDFDNESNSIWRIAMSWAKPTVSLDLVHDYQIWRSTDGVDFGDGPVGSTSKNNLTFTDVMPEQAMYYYKITACDNANSCGMPTDIASKYPTGHFTEPAKLTPGSIEVSGISTRRATIKWLTELESDSQVIFDNKPGLNPKKLTEVGDSKTQTKIHSVSLTNLQPGTKYYYQARWTNIDDFTGTSGELSFTTLPAPAISEVSADKITISGGTVNFTVDNASKMNIYYGKTESFGGAKTINTSSEKSAYSIALSDLDDNTKYYFKLNGFDEDGNEYQGYVFAFTTLPRPRISNLRFQPVADASSNTTKVSWITNVPASSELSYGLLGAKPSELIESKLVAEHEMTISGLDDDSNYTLIARSRDAHGNLAISERQTLKTALDTRPPKISNVMVENSITGSGAESRGQVVVSWETDEPATSQVAYGQGSPDRHSNKTSEDSNLSTEHVVIISDLATSSIYQIQPISKDKAANEAKADNQSTIIGRGTENVFTIIFNSLRKVFGIKWR